MRGSADVAIRLVGFDLDGTLRVATPTSLQSLVLIFEEVENRKVAQEDFVNLRRWEDAFWMLHGEKVSNDNYGEYVAGVAGQLGVGSGGINKVLDVIRQRIASAQGDVSKLQVWQLAEGARDFLEWIRGGGKVTIAVVTNNGDEGVIDSFVKEHLPGLVDFWMTTGDGIAPKPGKMLFDMALDRAGCSGDEAVFVGDSFCMDYEGAIAAGWRRAVLVDDCNGETAFPEAAHSVAGFVELANRWVRLIEQ